MSSNDNHIISLHNYEEWFVLYMDDELTAEQKKAVEAFLLLHPHLQQELDVLLSTKLPAYDLVFAGKEELLSPSMKLNAVEEDLLLYIDNELPPAGRMAMEEKISAQPEYRFQHDLLQKTKVDAAERIPYPDKKELYRHSEKVILFPVWMRIAAIFLLLLFGSYFPLFNQEGKPVDAGSAAIQPAPVRDIEPAGKGVPHQVKPTQITGALPQPDLTAKSSIKKKAERKEPEVRPVYAVKEQTINVTVAAEPQQKNGMIEKAEAIQVDVKKLLSAPNALNNSMANLPVTSAPTAPLNITDDPEESIVTDGDDKPKRTPAKGFFRKVSRFIERRTGIGTVNADNELWVGAVAIKLN